MSACSGLFAFLVLYIVQLVTRVTASKSSALGEYNSPSVDSRRVADVSTNSRRRERYVRFLLRLGSIVTSESNDGFGNFENKTQNKRKSFNDDERKEKFCLE